MLYLLCIISLAFIPMTVLVIAAGIAVFALISWAIERNVGETAVISNSQLIEFHNAYVILLIIAQLLSIIFFIKYPGNLAADYSAVSGENYTGLGAKIELYDTNIFNYIFTYVGAPIVNLDTFLRTSDIIFFRGVPDSPIFAAHNFRGLYAYQVKVNSGGMVATVTSALLKGHLYGVLGIIYTMRSWQKRHLQSLMKNGLQKKN